MNAMKTQQTTERPSPGASLRVILAIAAKDIVEAVKNKTLLANILLLPVLIVFYKWLPTLYNPDGVRIVVYDPGPSLLAIELANSAEFDLREAHSQQELAEKLDNMPMPVLGLSIPVGFDQALTAGQPPAIDGYVMHWVSDDKAAELQALFEEQFSAWTGQPVQIRLEGNALTPLPDSMGPIRSASIAIAVVIVFSGLMVVPLLLIEEKQARTLDAILISPATSGQIVGGKALAGSFYGLATMGVALWVNQSLIVHWGWVLLAALAGLLLGVAIGLAMGVFFERKQEVSSWGMLIFTILLGPVFLTIMEPILPKVVQAAFSLMPAVALAKAFRFSLSRGATPAQVAVNLGGVVGCALLVLAVVVWRLRRSDN